MGDPVGIGPEIIVRGAEDGFFLEHCRPVIIGDLNILKRSRDLLSASLTFNPVTDPEAGEFRPGKLDVICTSSLAAKNVRPGCPDRETGIAMVSYIRSASEMAMSHRIDAIATCPINKAAMRKAGYTYNGHTEMLAEWTGGKNYAMMMAGNRLRIVLVTIHVPLVEVPGILTIDSVFDKISLTRSSLQTRFGIENPKIAVAGLNPHAGEDGLFGSEEEKIILPAVERAQGRGWKTNGPLPPDTVFHLAAHGEYDAVVAMYHDQGLIPFKLLHFSDGVNTTLGLPICRTSVDHGTAYDIAGTGTADPGSLKAAVVMAASQAGFMLCENGHSPNS
jgi:4-hydroxythreonine-4-phosphate dehydrogenase